MFCNLVIGLLAGVLWGLGVLRGELVEFWRAC